VTKKTRAGGAAGETSGGDPSGGLDVQAPPIEERHAAELAFLAAWDPGPRPPGWTLSPRAVVTFVLGSGGETLHLSAGASTASSASPSSMKVTEKLVGARAMVERCVVTLAGQRGLLLVGEPGTAKSMLSELLAAAISGSSGQTVQGTAGTTEDQLRYGWNYAMLIAKGPSPAALVPSPILAAMRKGAIARVEEITRCLPEVQDALVSILSDRVVAVPELGDAHLERARQGFNVIATANLRDRGVSEMSAALKRRFNFEIIEPIAEASREIALVRSRAEDALARAGQTLAVDDAVLEAVVTVFRDLRSGRTVEGWGVERPASSMSTAEAVSVVSSLGFTAAFFPSDRDLASAVPGHLLGVILKDDAKDRGRLLAYWDSAVKRRADEGRARLWHQLYQLRHVLETTPTTT